MMSQFAQNTEVSVEKTRAEIERTIQRYGAIGFISGWQGGYAMVSFEMKDRRVKFLLPLPDRKDRQYTHSKRGPRDESTAFAAWEQACRQKWRALGLAIKAKLEAVESKIATFDEEFLSYVVTSNGYTIGEQMMSRMNEIVSTSKLPPMLPGPGQSAIQ